ncbi:MAG: hypothetical protein EHM55_03660 [Acidobacteria bacterium]|jgi:hypothetical protein|nr:MAG: hypothetical protein EHM55_03660 [Acidobacteriota bacterium]
MIFTRRLAAQGQTRQFTIEHSDGFGWIAREQDERETQTSLIRNWRRVEAQMVLFEMKASALLSEGWLET